MPQSASITNINIASIATQRSHCKLLQCNLVAFSSTTAVVFNPVLIILHVESAAAHNSSQVNHPPRNQPSFLAVSPLKQDRGGCLNSTEPRTVAFTAVFNSIATFDMGSTVAKQSLHRSVGLQLACACDLRSTTAFNLHHLQLQYTTS